MDPLAIFRRLQSRFLASIFCPFLFPSDASHPLSGSGLVSISDSVPLFEPYNRFIFSKSMFPFPIPPCYSCAQPFLEGLFWLLATRCICASTLGLVSAFDVFLWLSVQAALACSQVGKSFCVPIPG